MLALAVCLAAAVTGPGVLAGEESAPLQPGKVSVARDVVISEARLVEHVVGATQRPKVDAFVFVVDRASWRGAARVSLSVTTGHGVSWTFQTRVEQGRETREIRIPAGLEISSEMEGPFEARLTITAGDGVAFDGEFSFGYPRYTRTLALRRESTSTVRDAFEAPVIDTKRWRVWLSDPSKARVEQKGGRLWIEATGEVSYNGLASIERLALREVVAVCRTGVTSSGTALHAAIVHLCGSGPLSPDYWFEVQIRDETGGSAMAHTEVSTPRGEPAQAYRGPYALPGDGKQGHLVKVECEAATTTCSGSVEVSGEWWRIGDAFDVPARESHLEVKTAGGVNGGGSSRIWFDDCRIYPRPATHDVSVMLRRRDGLSPITTGLEPVCFDGENESTPGCDLRVQLLTADGATVIDETRVGRSFGFAMLRLTGAPWSLYPVAARIRVLAGERALSPDQIIESAGVEGLYPDDVYVLTID